MRRAKIICTLGPAVDSPEAIRTLVDAGMDCARLNFSHGTHEGHLLMAERVRAAAVAARRHVAILSDMCGPKIRIGRFKDGAITLEEGASFRFTTEEIQGDADRISVSYPQLPQDVVVGDPVLLDDGLLRLRVTAIEGNDVVCEVEVGGALSDRKGLNLPGAKLSIPAVTDKDKIDLRFAVDTLKTDYLAISFVRSPEDVHEAKALAKGTPVIAKIEKPEAIEALEAIADVADGLMIARGDLGVEVGSEKVPIVQKRIIQETNKRGKIVITATQMLDSMIRNPRPTRAEAADVANAILDGSDALMLSGETAAGRYPKEAVQTMGAIITEVEAADEGYGFSYQADFDQKIIAKDGWETSNAAGRAAALLSFVVDLKAIVVFTRGGHSAQLLSENRPKCPIVAITGAANIARRLALEWGVQPFVEIPPEDMEETLRTSTVVLVREKFAQHGDNFAIVSGWPPSARPNTVKLHSL